MFSPHCYPTLHFLCYSPNISTQIAAHPRAFLWPFTDVPEPPALHWQSPCSTGGVTAKEYNMSRPGCCITLLWGLLGGYSQIVPCHVEKGIGEWKEGETFISCYMIAAWRHPNFHIVCIHPMQSGSDSSLNIITAKTFNISDVWIWVINYKWQKS